MSLFLKKLDMIIASAGLNQSFIALVQLVGVTQPLISQSKYCLVSCLTEILGSIFFKK